MIYAKLTLRKFETKLNNFSAPFLETLQPCKTKDVLIGIVLFLVALLALASLCTEAFIGGDAAVYAQQMKNLNFSDRSVHIGYYLLGAGFIRIFPGSDDYALNLMNCFLGALSVMLLYLITFVICHRHLAALISGLFLLTHYIFLENSIYAEVYTPRTCFLLLAILWWLLDRPVIAGLSFAFSFLITPSTIFALPLFFILRPRFRPFLLFCVVFLAVAIAAILPVYRDYFFGSRGLQMVLHQSFNLWYILRREAGEVFFSFFLCIPFVVAGLAELFGEKKFCPLGIALLTLWAVSLFLGEKDWNDFPVQLPTYALLCVVGGLGVHLLLRISNNKKYAAILSGIILSSLTVAVILIKITKTPAQLSVLLPVWLLVATVSCAALCMLVVTLTRFRRVRTQVIIAAAVIFTVVINGFVAFTKMRAINKYHTGYRNTVIEMGKIARPDHLVIGDFTKTKLLEHYLFGESYTHYFTFINIKVLLGSAGKEKQLEVVKKINEAAAARRPIWLLRNYSGLFPALQRLGYKITQFGYVYLATPLNRV